MTVEGQGGERGQGSEHGKRLQVGLGGYGSFEGRSGQILDASRGGGSVSKPRTRGEASQEEIIQGKRPDLREC